MDGGSGASSLDLDPSTRAAVMMALLGKNRDEITFWQGQLLTASFWFNGAILGGAAFALRGPMPADASPLLAVGILLFMLFYIVFALLAKKAIEHTGRDLLKIQSALRLTGAGEYLAEGAIYASGDRWLPQRYIWLLIALNVTLSLASAFAAL